MADRSHNALVPALAATSGAALAFPGSVGDLDAYIRAVNRIPLLSADEEHELARRFQQGQDLDAARKLVMAHLRLVVSVSRQYLGYGLPHSDLIQEGNIGLMKAVKRFEPERGVRLVSFALHWIKAEIHEYIVRNWRLVKVATTKAQRKLFFNLRSMRGEQALTPARIEEVAATLNVKPSDVVEMEMRLGGHDVALDPTPADGEELSGTAPIAYLEAPGSEPSDVLAARGRAWLEGDGLQEALGSLDERSRHIVEQRWLADEPMTLQQLAAIHGVSAERVRQIETRALKKMKEALAAYA